MKTLAGIVLLLLAASIASSQHKLEPAVSGGLAPRFQLVTATLNEEGSTLPDQKRMFMVDSQTGSVWIFHHGRYSEGADGKSYWHPDYMETINIASISK